MTDRPFTVVVCSACAANRSVAVIDELRPIVRRCPHGMLVSADCMLGPPTCACGPSGRGVMAALQPCTRDRAASGPCHLIGPIADMSDAAALTQWIELGQWEITALPRELGAHQSWARTAPRTN